MSRLKWFTDLLLRCKESSCKKFDCDLQHQGISLKQKLCYAAGGIPYQMTNIAMAVSLQIFLLDVVQMEAFYVSMILFVSRAWDAVTDPLVGLLVTRSRWTPIGKLSPWLVLSTPFSILFYVLLWFVPHGSMSAAQIVLWFLTVSCLFETLMSCFNVPYLSLNMSLGGTKRERDSATAYRMSVEMAARLLASVIQGRVVTMYNSEKQRNCEQLDLVQETADSPPPPPPATSLQETKRAFLTSALVIGAMFFLCSLIIFFGVKEHRSSDGSSVRRRVPFLTFFKKLVCFVPYHRLLLAFTVSTLAYQMSLGNFALFCSHAAGLGAYFQPLVLVLLGSASIAVPIWQVVLLKIGKKATVFIGLTLFIPAVILMACLHSNLTVFIVMCAVMGFSVATVFLLPWSMLPDVVDEFAVRNPDCKDLEPLFFSCYAFCNKLAGSLSAGVSIMVLQFVGYKPSACTHSEEVVTALIVLFAPLPVALLLLGILAFLFYPVNERQSPQPQEQIFTVDSQKLSSAAQNDSIEEISCAAATCTSSFNIKRLQSDHLPVMYSRAKCAVHPDRHRLLTEKKESTETNPQCKSKVSWV